MNQTDLAVFKLEGLFSDLVYNDCKLIIDKK